MRRQYRFSLILGGIVLGVVFGFAWTSTTSGVDTRGAVPNPERQSGGDTLTGDTALSPAGRGSRALGADTPAERPEASAGDAEAAAALLWLRGHVTDEQGRPIGRALVWARARGALVEDVDERALTDEDGAYLLGPLPPGLYHIVFYQQGYAPHRLDAHPLWASETLDAVLREGAAIRGVVVDAAGHVVKQVPLFLQKPEAPHGTSLDMTVSAEDGTFLLEAPTPGPWRVYAEHHEFLGTDMDLTAPARDVRFVLRAGAAVEVTVVDERGRPVPEASITLREVEPNGTSWARKMRAADKLGRCVMRGLASRRYVVVAHAPGDALRAAAQQLELREEETRRVRLELRSGQLRISGVAVDAGGRPLEGVLVRVLPLSAFEPSRKGEGTLQGYLKEELIGQWRYDPAEPVKTGPDGRFTLNHLWPGEYWVDASRRGYVLDVRATGLPVGEGTDPWPRVSAGAGDVRLVLAYRGLIHGRVVGPDGKPVTWFLLEDKPWRTEDGTFDWPVEHAGRSVLRISAPGYAVTTREVEVRGGEDLSLGDVVLGEGRSVRVRVVDAESSGPVKGASIRLWTQAGELESLVDPYTRAKYETRADGTVTLQAVDARPLELVVWHRDYVKARVPLDPEQSEVTVRLEPGAIVQGWLRVGGQPLAGDGWLALYAPDGTLVASASVEKGWYTLNAVPPGRHIARATCGSACGQVFAPRLIEVPERGTLALDFEASGQSADLEVRTQGAVESVVLIAGRQPPPADLAGLRAVSTWGYPAQRLEGREGFRFERLAAGLYTLLAVRYRGAGVDVHQEELRISEGGHALFELQPRWRFLGRRTGAIDEPRLIVE